MLNFSSPAAESTHLDLLQIPGNSLDMTTDYDQPKPMDDSTAVESSSFQSHTNNNMDTSNDNSSFNIDTSYTVPPVVFCQKKKWGGAPFSNLAFS